MVCRDFILPEPASYVFFYAFSNLRKLLYIINTTAFALSLTFDLASIRFKVRPFKLLRAPSPHDHLPRLPILRILSEQSRRFLLGAEQHNSWRF